MDLNRINGEKIKRARQKQGFTLEVIASKVGVTKQAVSNWETGRNRPDESIRESIETVLGIKLDYRNQNGDGDMRIRPLEEINTIEELLNEVEGIVGAIPVDYAHQVTVRKILQMLLIQVLGYNCYYVALFHPSADDPVDWGSIAFDVKSIISYNDYYPLPNDEVFQDRFEDLMLRKIRYLSVAIGEELFEDFDEGGYRDGFPQQIGSLAEVSGYDLINILPGTDSSLMSMIKTAILTLSEYINQHARQ